MWARKFIWDSRRFCLSYESCNSWCELIYKGYWVWTSPSLLTGNLAPTNSSNLRNAYFLCERRDKGGGRTLVPSAFFPPFSPPTNYNIVTQNSSSSLNWQLGNEGMVAEGFWSGVRAESPRRQISSFHGHLHRFLYIIPQNTLSCCWGRGA